MRCVLCDDDRMLRSMVELVLTRGGHEVVGVAENTTDGSALVRATRPDLVILDGSLGFNTDFDVIEAAAEVKARVIVFSFYADEARLIRAVEPPIIVPKPDFNALEEVIAHLPTASGGTPVTQDRRQRPARSAIGPLPAGTGDSSAFYQAMSNGADGDSLVSIDLPADAPPLEDGGPVIAALAKLIRGSDRLLAAGPSVKVFLPAGGPEGAASFVERARTQGDLPPEVQVHSVVIEPGEAPVDAFDRLKQLSAGGQR